MNDDRDMFGARPGEYPIPAYGRVAKCASCSADIVWTKTDKGRPMPLSLATAETRDGVCYALTHFSDCPEAKDWSKKGGQ
jgi:hypothetical protein